MLKFWHCTKEEKQQIMDQRKFQILDISLFLFWRRWMLLSSRGNLQSRNQIIWVLSWVGSLLFQSGHTTYTYTYTLLSLSLSHSFIVNRFFFYRLIFLMWVQSWMDKSNPIMDSLFPNLSMAWVTFSEAK